MVLGATVLGCHGAMVLGATVRCVPCVRCCEWFPLIRDWPKWVVCARRGFLLLAFPVRVGSVGRRQIREPSCGCSDRALREEQQRSCPLASPVMAIDSVAQMIVRLGK